MVTKNDKEVEIDPKSLEHRSEAPVYIDKTRQDSSWAGSVVLQRAGRARACRGFGGKQLP